MARKELQIEGHRGENHGRGESKARLRRRDNGGMEEESEGRRETGARREANQTSKRQSRGEAEREQGRSTKEGNRQKW